MHGAEKRVAAMVGLLALAAAGCHADAGPLGVEVPADAIALEAEELVSIQTAWSGFEEPARTLITDDEAWQAAWATLYRHHSPVPERPAIDFGSHVVILAAMGSRPSGGYSVSVESVQHHEGALYVSVLERSPGDSCGTLAAITAPVHIVQVSREGTSAVFAIQRETVSC